MPTRLTSLLQSSHLDRPLNILNIYAHGRYAELLARTGHNFWAVQSQPWDYKCANKPENYVYLHQSIFDIPQDIKIDLVLLQHRELQHDTLITFSETYKCPVVYLEHTLPMPSWNNNTLKKYQSRRGKANVFISDYSRKEWGFEGEGVFVVEHGVDTEQFKPGYYKHPVCLSIVNDWIKRDTECGFTFWKEATANLPTVVLGNTDGLSKPAESLEDLIFAYQTSLIFVNTARISPIPTVLLEAMACGCCVVSTPNPMIESIIANGKNGFLCNTAEEMRSVLQKLLNNREAALTVGEAGRQTVLNRFSVNRFVKQWNEVFNFVTQ